jgi:hypothetical protein
MRPDAGSGSTEGVGLDERVADLGARFWLPSKPPNGDSAETTPVSPLPVPTVLRSAGEWQTYDSRCLKNSTQTMSLTRLNSVLLAIAATIATGQTPKSSQDLLGEDRTVIDESLHLWCSKADSIWPHASEVRIPMLYIKSDTEYAVGFPNPSLDSCW